MDFDLLCPQNTIIVNNVMHQQKVDQMAGDEMMKIQEQPIPSAEQNTIIVTKDEGTKYRINFKKIISHFKMPADIKNDIIYCQKSLRTYLKAHQMIVTHYGNKIAESPPIQKEFDELERELYEINAEQKFLILRFQKALDEFYDTLSSNIYIDHDAANAHFATVFNKHVDDLNYCYQPVSVKKRKLLHQLLHKFGFFEIPDKVSSLSLIQQQMQMQMQMQNNLLQLSNTLANNNILLNACGTQFSNQVSLLKPKSERLSNGAPTSDVSAGLIPEFFTETASDQFPGNKIQTELKTLTSKFKAHSVKSSPAINNSRMNLLQALNKAKNQSLFLSNTSQSMQSNQSLQQPNVEKSTEEEAYKISILKNKSKFIISQPMSRKAEKIELPNKDEISESGLHKTKSLIPAEATEVDRKPQGKSDGKQSTSSSHSSTSEDSIEYMDLYPELKKEEPEPSDYNQEMFLRLFNLYTIEHSTYLQQRRSKRKRRNVQSNEKKEYHYGNLDNKEISLLRERERIERKKVFLASPPPKRKRNAFKPVSSSSLEEKILCNQCSKNGESGLSRCEHCHQYFHARCHTGAFLKKLVIIRSKICPPCYRANGNKKLRRSVSSEENDKERHTTLLDEAEKLTKKMNLARSRREDLLVECQQFKSQMNELYALVDKIKNEPKPINSTTSTLEDLLHGIKENYGTEAQEELSSLKDSSGNWVTDAEDNDQDNKSSNSDPNQDDVVEIKEQVEVIHEIEDDSSDEEKPNAVSNSVKDQSSDMECLVIESD